jgi:hypothetical protein
MGRRERLPARRPPRGQPRRWQVRVQLRDATTRPGLQTAKGQTKADARTDGAELLARLRRGERVEHATLTLSEVAHLWLERASRPQGHWADSTRDATSGSLRQHIDSTAPRHHLAGVLLPLRRPRPRRCRSRGARRQPHRDQRRELQHDRRCGNGSGNTGCGGARQLSDSVVGDLSLCILIQKRGSLRSPSLRSGFRAASASCRRR